MELVFWILMEMSMLAARPVVPEMDGRPTRIEMVRPDVRPSRIQRPRR